MQEAKEKNLKWTKKGATMWLQKWELCALPEPTQSRPLGKVDNKSEFIWQQVNSAVSTPWTQQGLLTANMS